MQKPVCIRKRAKNKEKQEYTHKKGPAGCVLSFHMRQKQEYISVSSTGHLLGTTFGTAAYIFGNSIPLNAL